MAQRSVPVPLFASAAVTIALFLAQVFARESHPPGSGLRLALTVALIAAFGVTIWIHVRLSASLDEFNRQVQYFALAIAFPVSLVAAFAIGYLAGDDYTETKLSIGGQEASEYFVGCQTFPFNIASKHPVLAVPSGRASNGVPTGVQIVAPTYDDVTAFRIGAAAERQLGWWRDPAWRPG